MNNQHSQSDLHSGNLILVLHSHMPWVLGHGGWPHGEDWLSEAIAECYIPLLNSFNQLVDEGISPKVTIGISPILCEMLADENYKVRFIEYCKNKVEFAKQDEINFEKRLLNNDGSLNQNLSEKEVNDIKNLIFLSKYWQNFFNQTMVDYLVKYNQNILGAFKNLQDNNHLEIITCGATHGYFPLLATESSIRFQIKVAVENYKKHFGRNPKGIWLPECAYRSSYEWKSLIPVAPFNKLRLRPGIEQFLKEYEIDFFITDEALTKQSELLGWFADKNKSYFLTKEHEHQEYFFKPNPLKVYNIASGIFSTTENAAIFTRDVSLALQVWSGEIGYPADGVYLDFHKKEMNSMLRYWSVTSVKLDMAYKEVYSPIKTKKSIDLQSNHYIHIIENTANNFKEVENQKATVCLPFDTELYGHWWFEGVEFLTNLIRGIYHSPYIDSQTCSNELQIKQPTEVIKLKEGSWGENNNHDVWSNIQTYWIWEEIYNTELKLQKLFRILTSSLLNDLVNKLSENTNNKNVLLIDRIIKQLLRENLLLQASDWSFLITNQSAKDYAEMRFSYHLSDFNRLYDLIAPNIDLIKKSIYDNGNFAISDDELVFLTDTEKRNNPFAEIDYRWFEIDSSLNL